jgi:crotonobetainyl-CoA:carnitine CoA-transferase CaiB-like acyl-CoA transferase
MFLSDLGAEVIHVERREGDMMRAYPSLWGNKFLLDHDRNTFTEDLLRNKRSLTVDLNRDEGREIVYRLVDKADVFLTNFRPAAVAKQRMDYETLSARNPRLIYAHGTSYGNRGPDRDSPGLEMMGIARSGLMLSCTVEGAEPGHLSVGLNDRLGAIGLFAAVVTALFARERTGLGQLVQTSLLGWAVSLQASAIACAANTGQNPRPIPRRDENDPLYNTYQMKDGTWIALGMTIHPEKFWPLVCEALDRPELVDDPRFISVELREENHEELISILDDAFGDLTFDVWDKRVHDLDLIACRVNALTDLTSDQQILANEYLVHRSHPELGGWWHVPTPIDYEKTPVSVRSVAPHVGQHTTEILAEIGYSEEEIEDLRVGGVITPLPSSRTASPTVV